MLLRQNLGLTNPIPHGKPLSPLKSANSTLLIKLNESILFINATVDPISRYVQMVKLYFKIYKQLTENIPPAEKEILQKWLMEENFHKQISKLGHVVTFLSVASNPEDKNSITYKSLIKTLKSTKKSLKNSLRSIQFANESTNKLINLFQSFILESKQAEQSNFHALTMNLINSLTDIKEDLLSFPENKVSEKKDPLEKCHDLFKVCHDTLLQVIYFIQTQPEYIAAIQESFNRKIELDHSLVTFLQKLNLDAFSAMQLQNLSYFANSEAEVSYLGGHSNLVYKVQHNETELTVKIYPYEKGYYEFLYNRALEVRNKLGPFASKILGKIYHEREVIKFSQNSIEKLGRIEVSDFCQNGSFEQAIQKLIKMRRKKNEFFDADEMRGIVIDQARKSASLVKVLVDFNIFAPDIKPGNFFVTKAQNIFMSDYKTLVVCPDFNVIPGEIEHTKAYLPPEVTSEQLKAGGSCNILAMMKYQLGLSLYELATCDLNYKFNKQNPKFSDNIFQGSDGQVLLEVIQSLLDPKPENRMDLAIVIAKLESLQPVQTQQIVSASKMESPVSTFSQPTQTLEKKLLNSSPTLFQTPQPHACKTTRPPLARSERAKMLDYNPQKPVSLEPTQISPEFKVRSKTLGNPPRPIDPSILPKPTPPQIPPRPNRGILQNTSAQQKDSNDSNPITNSRMRAATLNTPKTHQNTFNDPALKPVPTIQERTSALQQAAINHLSNHSLPLFPKPQSLRTKLEAHQDKSDLPGPKMI